MNILIITPNYPDKNNKTIGSIFVKRQVEELKKYVDNIYIVVPVPYYSRIINSNTRKYSKSYSYDNVKVFYLNTIPSILLSKFRPFQKLRYISPLSAIARLIKSEDLEIDLIHALFTNPSGILASMLKKKYGYKYVITIHENSNWFMDEYNSDDNYIYDAWKSAETIIRVNPFDIHKLKRHNENTIYIANGYSTQFKLLDKSFCRQKLGIGAEDTVIFSLGMLIKRKGHHILVLALKELIASYPNLLCYIAGDGKERDTLQNLISENKLENNCRLLGFVSNNDLPFWLNATDLFVLPTFAEGNPTVMFEALGCGKPFIGTNVGGIPSVIDSDDYGYICNPGSVEELVEIIKKGIEKEWDTDKIYSYSQQFTWDSISKTLVEVYEKVK